MKHSTKRLPAVKDRDRKSQMKFLSDNGLNNVAIGEYFGISSQRVYQVLGPQHKAQKKDKQIIDLLRAGYTDIECHKLTGRRIRNFERYGIHYADFEAQRRNRRIEKVADEIIALLKAGTISAVDSSIRFINKPLYNRMGHLMLIGDWRKEIQRRLRDGRNRSK